MADAARSCGSSALSSVFRTYALAAALGDLKALTSARKQLQEDARWYDVNASGTDLARTVNAALAVVLKVAPGVRIIIERSNPPPIVLRVENGKRRVIAITRALEKR